MQPLKDGVWGCRGSYEAAGYASRRAEETARKARAIMKKRATPHKVTAADNLDRAASPLYKDPGGHYLAASSRRFWIDADVDIIDTAQWFPRVARNKNYSVGLPQTTGQRASTTPTRTLTINLVASRAQLHGLLQSENRRSCSTCRSVQT